MNHECYSPASQVKSSYSNQTFIITDLATFHGHVHTDVGIF